MSNTRVYSVKEALLKMQHYCAYQERSHFDVRRQLQKMGMIPEVIEHIMVELIKDDYLNESRYAKTFVSGKFKIKKWGRHRLYSELRKKDISKINIELALSQIDPDQYLETFNALAQKRLESIKESNKLKKKKKLADYLLYRGWESQLVYEKVNELVK